MNDIVYAELHSAPGQHTHDAWEFVCCTAGTGSLLYEGGSVALKAGETGVIPAGISHRHSGERGFRCVCLHISQPTLAFQEPAAVLPDGSAFLQNAFEAALYHVHRPDPRKAALLSAYGSLIVCYLGAFQTARRHTRLVESIAQHILLHHADPAYALDGFLRSLPFNYDYLRKLFQKEMGLTPHQFLNSVRLERAAEALISGEQVSSMADIARQCGFREPLYFSRMFKKKYGTAPSLYAQSARKGPLTDEDA